MSRTQVAVIGLGGIAQAVHLPLLQRQRARVDLVALAELSPSRLHTIAARYGVPEHGRFHSTDDLLAAIRRGQIAVDAAIVATAGTHVTDALALVHAGVRVLVEKPLAYSASELDRLDAELADLGKDPADWIRVGYMKNYDPAVARARELLADVNPLEVRVEVLHPADDRQLAFARLEPPATDVPAQAIEPLTAQFDRVIDDATGTNDAESRRLYSNVMLGSIVHDLALTRYLGLGLHRVIHAEHRGHTVPGSVIAAGRTAADVPWNLSWHFASELPEYRETVTIHHERGTVQLRFATPYLLNAPTVLTATSGADDLRSVRTEMAWPQQEAFERELDALIGMPAGQSPPGCSTAAAREDMTQAQALWRACIAGFGPDAGSAV